jgi:hypothetical protein
MAKESKIERPTKKSEYEIRNSSGAEGLDRSDSNHQKPVGGFVGIS